MNTKTDDANKKFERSKNLNEMLRMKENLNSRLSKQIRSEYDHDQQTELINEILRMVKNKLNIRSEDDVKPVEEENRTERSTTLKAVSQKKQTFVTKSSSLTRKGAITNMANFSTPANHSVVAFEGDKNVKVLILHH